jgi:hypothetical protein
MNNVWKWLKSLWSSIFADFIKEVFTEAKTKIIAALKDVAIKAVTELSVSDLTSDAKRKEAFKRIASYAKSKGIAAGDSLINLVLEMAVSKVKG